MAENACNHSCPDCGAPCGCALHQYGQCSHWQTCTTFPSSPDWTEEDEMRSMVGDLEDDRI